MIKKFEQKHSGTTSTPSNSRATHGVAPTRMGNRPSSVSASQKKPAQPAIGSSSLSASQKKRARQCAIAVPSGLLRGYLPIVIAVMLLGAVPALADPQPSNKKPDAAKSPAPAATAPAATTPGGKPKIQIIVLAKPGTTKDNLKESLDHVGGTVVSSTTDGTNTFYLIEVDQDTSDNSIKTLTKDKNFKSVSLNRKIHQFGI